MRHTLLDNLPDGLPEGFEDDLIAFIDQIESKVNDIRDGMEINGLDELHQIDDAHDLAGELSRDLY